MAQHGHQPDDVRRHRALGLLRVVRANVRLTGLSIAAHVGADDREPAIDQLRRDSMPRRSRTRMAVNEHNRTTLPGVPNTQLHLSDIDPLVCETFEHPRHIPKPSRATTI
jgi:hypothetical protein